MNLSYKKNQYMAIETSKDIAYASIAGTAIGTLYILGNMLRIGTMIDIFLMPLIFLGFKRKRKSMPMIWAAIVGATILLGYKFYHAFFVLAYYLIALTLDKFKLKLNIISFLSVALVYSLSLIATWYLALEVFNHVGFIDTLKKVVNGAMTGQSLLSIMILLSPLFTSLLYFVGFNYIFKSKIFGK